MDEVSREIFGKGVWSASILGFVVSVGEDETHHESSIAPSDCYGSSVEIGSGMERRAYDSSSQGRRG